MSLINLPVEILVHIFKSLDLSDLRILMISCKTLKNIILGNSSIWKSVCRNKMLIDNLSYNCKHKGFSTYHQFRISNNWCSGIYRSKVIIHHQTYFMPWLRFYNSEALLLSLGSKLQCFPTNKKGMPLCKVPYWQFEVPIIKRDDIRTNDISRFIMKNNMLVCGNRDGCISVFQLEDLTKRPRLLYHINNCHEDGLVEVSAVESIIGTENSYAISGSIFSSNILFWYLNNEGFSPTDHINNFSVKDVRLSNEIGIRCLSMDDNNEILAIGPNGNRKPLLLDVNTSNLLMTAENTMDIRQTVRDIGWHDQNTIVYVTHSGILQLIDIRTKEVVYDIMDPFQSTFYCMKSDRNHAVLVGTSEYSRCVLFDIRNSASHVQMYFTQKKSSPVYSLDFDSVLLIAAADRSTAALNFNVDSSSTRPKDYSHKFQIVSG